MLKPLIAAGAVLMLAACSGSGGLRPDVDRSPRDSLNNNFDPTTRSSAGSTPRDESNANSSARGGPGTGAIR
ncbi:hypothetical protein [Roseomonas elaeocarpi]|uniref:Lipoprotein n=1 Tax=Roseomonas elaeocarpi TaxID=907779 RepID=A0ABV6JUU7_9PROT